MLISPLNFNFAAEYLSLAGNALLSRRVRGPIRDILETKTGKGKGMRFIQAGVGGFGKGWVKRLTDHEDVEVVGLADVSRDALAAAREIGQYKNDICFPTVDAALKNVEADALVCVTPPEYHAECVVRAMEAGLNVITEKPMADSMANCMSMLKTARETGRTCVVSQNYRYADSTWTLANLIEAGRVGDIGQVKIDFYMGVDFGGGFRHEMDYPVVVDMSIHHFDLIRFITKLDPVAVRGEAWNPPWSNYKGNCSSSLVFEMANGARIVYNACWCAKGQFSDWNGNWLIEGNTGSLKYESNSIELRRVPELYKVEQTEPVELEAPDKGGQDYVLDDFMSSVKAGTRPKTDAFDNIYSVAMVFAAVKAFETGERVAVLDDSVRKLIGNA